MKITYLFGIIIVLFSINSISNSLNIISYDLDKSLPLVVFNYKAGDVKSLSGIELVFFSVDDCQQNFLNLYREEIKFPLKKYHNFALLSDKTYKVVDKLFDDKLISNIHSVLIRLHGENNTLPRFLGGCADQGINCCIAIECAVGAGICLPKYQFPTQTFIFFKNYELS